MTKRKLIVLAIAASFLIALLGCEGSIEVTFFSVTGDVVNARTDSLTGVSDVTVTFTKVGGSSQTVTTSSVGSYNLEYEGEGEYKVTASKSGWFFIPQTVYIGNWRTGVPDILGIKLDEDFESTAISFILTWNDSYQDLDGRLTFPKGNGTGYGTYTPAYSITFQEPYEAIPGTDGFGPNTLTNREYVGGGSTRSTNYVSDVLGGGDLKNDGPAITVDRDDVDARGPEVITVRTLPHWIADWNSSSTYQIIGGGNTGLPSTATWTWVGIMEYYVDGWNATHISSDGITPGPRGTPESAEEHLISSQDGDGAEAVLHIVQGSTLLGVYKVPEYADLRTASLLRVNLFIGETATPGDTTWFQFVPDVQLVDYGSNASGILSTHERPAPVFGVYGAAR